MSPFDKLRVALQHRKSLSNVLRHSAPSFSQYGEDLVIDRLLKPLSGGTFVDVGSHHPINRSNTFRLYMRGWRGSAIDPNPEFTQDFLRYRPGDLFINEGVAAGKGNLTYHSFDLTVLNTFDTATVEKLLQEGNNLTGKKDVPCRPLCEIVDEFLPDKQIDLLNVDCEGLDMVVLESLRIDKHRPTVLIIEDYPTFFAVQNGSTASPLQSLLKQYHYSPLAQVAWSGIYIADNWRELFKLSEAFSADRITNGYLPGAA